MTRSLRTTAFAVLAWTALATMAMADEWSDNYEEATDKVVDKLKAGDDHDKIVAAAIDHYKNKGCDVYTAKTTGKNRSTNVDIIVVCKKTEKCKDGYVVLIEVKSGGKVDKAPSQLDAGAAAALKAGKIKKPDPKTVADCYHSVILVGKGKKLDKPKLLETDAGKTKIGDETIVPTWTDDVDKLPDPS